MSDFGNSHTKQNSFWTGSGKQRWPAFVKLLISGTMGTPRSGWTRFILFLRGEVGSRKSAAFVYISAASQVYISAAFVKPGCLILQMNSMCEPVSGKHQSFVVDMRFNLHGKYDSRRISCETFQSRVGARARWRGSILSCLGVSQERHIWGPDLQAVELAEMSICHMDSV